MSLQENHQLKRKRRKTIRVVRLVRKTSTGKLIVAAMAGILVGGFGGGTLVSLNMDEEPGEELRKERNSRIGAEARLYETQMAMQRIIDEKAASPSPASPLAESPVSIAAADEAGADIQRAGWGISAPIKEMETDVNLRVSSGTQSEEMKEWKSRYRYAALKFNQLRNDYAALHKKYIEITGASGATKGIITGEQFYRFLRKENKVKLDRCWDEKKKSLRIWERQKVEQDERVYTDRDSWLRNMAIRMGLEKV